MANLMKRLQTDIGKQVAEKSAKPHQRLGGAKTNLIPIGSTAAKGIGDFLRMTFLT